MTAAVNKKHFDVLNFYYAVGTKDDATGAVTYAAPVKEPTIVPKKKPIGMLKKNKTARTMIRAIPHPGIFLTIFVCVA